MNLPAARSRWLGYVASVLLLAAASLWTLAWNRFPFVYIDTATQLLRAAGGLRDFREPVFYSFWLGLFRAVAPGLTLGAALQSIVLASLLALLIFRTVATGRRLAAVTATGLILAFSPESFFTVLLHPDALAGSFVLCLGLMLLARRWPEAFFWALAAGSIALTHYSLVGLLLAGAALLLLIAVGLRRLPVVAAALAVSCGCVLTALCFQNYWLGLGVSPRLSSPIYLAGRLADDGTLAGALRAEAAIDPDPTLARRHREMAAEVAALPPGWLEFLYGGSSPLSNAFPNWAGNPRQFLQAREFLGGAVRRQILAHPVSFCAGTLRNVKWTASGRGTLVNIEPETGNGFVARALAAYSAADSARFRTSRQRLGTTPARGLGVFGAMSRIFVPAATLLAVLIAIKLAPALLLALRRRRALTPAETVVGWIAASFLLNLMICSATSAAAARYADRLAALPIIGVVLLAAGRNRPESPAVSFSRDSG